MFSIFFSSDILIHILMGIISLILLMIEGKKLAFYGVLLFAESTSFFSSAINNFYQTILRNGQMLSSAILFLTRQHAKGCMQVSNKK